MGHAASPPETGPESPHGFLPAAELRTLDALIGFFQRLRSRIVPAVAEEESVLGRKRSSAQAEVQVAQTVAAVPRRGRLISVLLPLLFLLAGGSGGAVFSYRLLSRVIAANETIADYQRDEIAQMAKEDARNLSTRAKLQQQVADDNKEIREYRVVVEEYKDLVEDLRNQLGAAKASAASPPQDNVARSATSARSRARPAPRKTGTCVMGPGSTAASLAHCVDDFNGK